MARGRLHRITLLLVRGWKTWLRPLGRAGHRDLGRVGHRDLGRGGHRDVGRTELSDLGRGLARDFALLLLKRHLS